MRVTNSSSQRGFTLVEVLIAFVILSFGLLGAVALQAKAKQASFDSMQRAAAVALGERYDSTDACQRYGSISHSIQWHI